jgi:hypothetical protein
MKRHSCRKSQNLAFRAAELEWSKYEIVHRGCASLVVLSGVRVACVSTSLFSLSKQDRILVASLKNRVMRSKRQDWPRMRRRATKWSGAGDSKPKASSGLLPDLSRRAKQHFCCIPQFWPSRAHQSEWLRDRCVAYEVCAFMVTSRRDCFFERKKVCEIRISGAAAPH